MNDLYEKAITLSKSIAKFSHLSKILNLNFTFQAYRIDHDANREIELRMLEKKNEKE